MSSVSLYTLAAQYQQDFMRLADLDLDSETVADTLDGMDGELEVKAANVAMFLRGLDATEAGMAAARDEMEARRVSVGKRAAAMRAYLLSAMTLTGILKVESPCIKITVQNNPVSVDIFELGLLPAFYMRTPEPKPPVAAPDKAFIKAALENGEDVPGSRLVRSQKLVIK